MSDKPELNTTYEKIYEQGTNITPTRADKLEKSGRRASLDAKRKRKSLMLSVETMERFQSSKSRHPEFRDFSNDRFLLYLLELENNSSK
ncbi:hypothetical protein K7432_008998 [Basidiobolus ranarum]|uniref:Uncharacterized protein n=1 Tax=Basidiobolus ranarum TaxID=34480 RepID=A0ABR2VXQ7_9FUNG